MKYEKGKGYFIGTFNHEDIRKGLDKEMVSKAQKKYNLKYTNTTIIKKNKENVGLKIWVCDFDDVDW